jgi:hypothetical protein
MDRASDCPPGWQVTHGPEEICSGAAMNAFRNAPAQ